MIRAWAGYALLMALLVSPRPTVADPANASVRLPQADGSTLLLQRPATRIIALAPSITELLFAAGAGDLVLATTEYSDYPPAASELPRIGDAFRFDLERILAHRPDLVIGWESGNPESALFGLEALGLTVWRTEVTTPEGIADQLEALGRATGRTESASTAASEVRKRLDVLRSDQGGRSPLTFFYQVAERPLYTVNDEHLISRALALCGAANAFADLPSLAPQVAREAVLLADPDVLVAPVVAGGQDPLAHWNHWDRLRAVRDGAFLYLPADEINRATPRLLDAIELACNLFDSIRQFRG